MAGTTVAGVAIIDVYSAADVDTGTTENQRRPARTKSNANHERQ